MSTAPFATEQERARRRSSSLVSLFLGLSVPLLFRLSSSVPLYCGGHQETEEVQLDEKALLCLPCVRPPLFTSFVDLAVLPHMLSLKLTSALFFFGRDGNDAGLKTAALATLGRLRLRPRYGRTAA